MIQRSVAGTFKEKEIQREQSQPRLKEKMDTHGSNIPGFPILATQEKWKTEIYFQESAYRRRYSAQLIPMSLDMR